MAEIFLEILNRSIAASWIVLGVIALRLLFKKAPKWIAVLLWAVVAVRLLCPFTIESVMSLIPSAETVSPDIMYQDTPQINSGIPVINATVNPYIGEHFGPTPYYSANPLQILIPSVAYGWLLGVFGMFSYALISWGLLKRKLKTAILLRENIFQSENVASPFVLGILKPRIYLPFEMQEQDASYVVAHERAHIRRKDHWWKPFGYLLLAIHWFNPLMWLGYLLLCRDIELACDEKVIKELGYEQKADYSQALLTCSVNRRIIAACPLAFGEVGVKERVKSVLKYKKPALWIVAVAVAVCVLFAGCFLTDRLNKDRTKDLNDWQQLAVKGNPELCNLDSKKGLDVYVIEKKADYYEYYLTSHRDVPYDCSSPEIKEAEFFWVGDMQWILYTYDIAPSDVHIVILPWDPETGFVGSYFSDIPGETPEQKEKRQAEIVRTIRYELLEQYYDVYSYPYWYLRDRTSADIDGDGKIEECYIIEANIFTNFPFYRLLARESGTKKWEYDSTIAEVYGNEGSYRGISFRQDAQGTVSITAEWNKRLSETKELHHFDIKTENKTVTFPLSSKTDVSSFDSTSIELMRLCPEYFGLDYSNGLDVYVWQMAKNSYSFGLLPHPEAPREWICDETMMLMNKGNLNAAQMRAILSTYPVGEEDIYIIPWQNPLSSYLGNWQIIEEGKDMDAVRQAYIESVRQMLFGPQTNGATLLYASPAASWVLSEVPDVFVKDDRLYDKASSLSLAQVWEITLTKESFPNMYAFGWRSAVGLENILENNLMAYEVKPISLSAVDLYYVLTQKDGSTILVYGHYKDGEKSNFIRWIFRIEE